MIELTPSELIGWKNHPVTQKMIYPALEKRRAELERLLHKVGGIDSVSKLELIQRELELISIFIGDPQKLLEHLQRMENPILTNERGF